MNRAMAYLVALAAAGGAAHLAGTSRAQAPAAAAPKAGGRVAVFNVAKVMREYQRWQFYAKQMNDKRMGEAQGIAKARADLAALQDQMAKEPVKTKQEDIQRQLLDKSRALEDRERQLRKVLDDESAGHLKNLFGEIQQVVKAIADTNGFDLVMAYPDAVTKEETESPMYFDLKMRPAAAMPFYVSPAVDATDLLVATLNKHFPPPAGVQQTGSTAPAGR